MKTLALIGLLVVCFVTVTGCGTAPLKHYPAGMTQQDAAKQHYDCLREANQAVPALLFAEKATQRGWMLRG